MKLKSLNTFIANREKTCDMCEITQYMDQFIKQRKTGIRSTTCRTCMKQSAHRRRIVTAIKDGFCSVSTISTETKIKQATVFRIVQHLMSDYEVMLRRGKYIIYSPIALVSVETKLLNNAFFIANALHSKLVMRLNNEFL